MTTNDHLDGGSQLTTTVKQSALLLRTSGLGAFAFAAVLSVAAFRRFGIVSTMAEVITESNPELGSTVSLVTHEVVRGFEYTSFEVAALAKASGIVPMVVGVLIMGVVGVFMLWLSFRLRRALG